MVFVLPDPAVVRVVVKEDGDAVLNCSFTSGSVKGKLFDWKKINDGGKPLEVYMYDKGTTYATRDGQDPQFKGRVSHFEDRLEAGDASIRIRKAEVRDTGSYTCEFPNDSPRLRSRISLVVGEYVCFSIRCRFTDETKTGKNKDPSNKSHIYLLTSHLSNIDV